MASRGVNKVIIIGRLGHDPEIRDSFNKVAKRVPAFKGILNEWDSLVALLKSEMKIHGNKAPETYRRISELRKD
ncbi:hypothetical protein [Escherichia coli]|uniref:hypothetical protein n=1 Tax=Escherichia coli TaxID=562 RepID=UPI00092FCEE2|nr:hypothetical protein [Escherichia coli]